MRLYLLTLRCMMLKLNPSRRVSRPEALDSFGAATNFRFWALSPSLPDAIVFCPPPPLSSTIGPFSLWLIYSSPPGLCPRVHRGHQTMAAIQPLLTSCEGWHHRDGSAHAVPWCWVHLEGPDNVQPPPSLSLLNIRQQIQNSCSSCKVQKSEAGLFQEGQKNLSWLHPDSLTFIITASGSTGTL